MEVLKIANIKKDNFYFTVKLIQYYGGFIVSVAEEYGDVIWDTVELYFNNQTEASTSFNKMISLAELTDSVKEIVKIVDN
jgi:hypothetical protein